MKSKRSLLQIMPFVCCLLVAACHLKQDTQYKLFSKTYYKHGQLWSGILKEPMMVQSYPCTGRVIFDSAGFVYEFILSKDHNIHGHLLPQYSIINIEGNTKRVNSSEPLDIQGYHIAGGTLIFTSFTIDTSGNLISFFTEDDIEIDGIPCRGMRGIQLYPDGRLWVCFLSGEYESGGTIYPPDTYLLIDENGKVQEYSHELYMDIRKRLGL